MSNGVPGGDDSSVATKEYEFTCSVCGQQIDVNGEMKGAILKNGCPVCASVVGEDDFDE